MNLLENFVESNLELLEFGSSQYYLEELNMKLAELGSSPYYFEHDFCEKLTLNLSNLVEYFDQIYKLVVPNFLDFNHLHKIDEKKQSELLTDILLVHNKNFSKILCFSDVSSKLGHGFLGGRKGSSILAYYYSTLAPLSSVNSDGVFTIYE